MGKILGLDLGTNSIGWAIVDDEKEEILGSGVRIFPEGVENLGEGENEQSKKCYAKKCTSEEAAKFSKKATKRTTG